MKIFGMSVLSGAIVSYTFIKLVLCKVSDILAVQNELNC